MAVPDVSVILPVYNGQRFIERSVRSVQRQTWPDFELLVVDDASSDDTAGIVARLARDDPRVELIASPVNRGPSASRNLGIARARGHWVAILDADDWYAPNRLETLLRAGNWASADVVCDDLLLFDDEKGEVIGPMFGAGGNLPPALDTERFIIGNLPDPRHPRRGYGFLKPLLRSDFLFRHGLFYDNAMRFAEDYAFYLSVLLAGARWLTVPDATYVYAVSSASLTANHNAEDLFRLSAVDRMALARTSDVAVLQALRRHLTASEKRAGWARFIELYKERRPAALLRTATASAPVFGHITAQCLQQLLIRSNRLRKGFAARRPASG